MTTLTKGRLHLLAVVAAGLILGGCETLGLSGGEETVADVPPPSETPQITPSNPNILGSLLGYDTAPAGTVLGVNAYLWRASLDTLGNLPIENADPLGGVIVTKWYAAPEAPAEQVKVQVYILDERLRADAVRVAVFRQKRQGEGWVDAPTDPATATRIEDAILTRARQLRVESGS